VADRPRTMRCAIYARKSTEEGLDQDFDSLDTQREAVEAYVHSRRQEGWTALPQRYDDGGFTGANLDRPGLKQLLCDIEAHSIDCVLVYKVDRLSRSLLDFARVVEVFDRRGVCFVSITQDFNTSTSIGRLTLHILLSFAQFEREIISERTRDKLGAARRKGKWIGGVPMLGYDVAPSGGRLIINEREAEQVREIFALYEQLGTVEATLDALAERNITNKVWNSNEASSISGDLSARARCAISSLMWFTWARCPTKGRSIRASTGRSLTVSYGRRSISGCIGRAYIRVERTITSKTHCFPRC
jgi:site-specific DNA recombinase